MELNFYEFEEAKESSISPFIIIKWELKEILNLTAEELIRWHEKWVPVTVILEDLNKFSPKQNFYHCILSWEIMNQYFVCRKASKLIFGILTTSLRSRIPNLRVITSVLLFIFVMLLTYLPPVYLILVHSIFSAWFYNFF